MKNILVISPHYDDAIGSCAGRILQENSKNQYSVLTVFSKPHGSCLSSVASHIHLDVWHTDNAYKTRHKENIKACSFAGVTPLDAPFLDAIYRMDKSGDWLYPGNGDIFKGIVKEDLELKEQIKEHILSFIGLYDKIIFPAGRGGHVDHLILTEIALSLCEKYKNIMFYNDFSYEEGTCNLPKEWRPVKHYISNDIQTKKETALAMYKSQINMLFGCEDNIHKHYTKYNKDKKGFFEIYYKIE